MPQPVVAYIRLSPTASDNEELERRLDTQREQCRQHAQAAGKEIVEEFVARRVSGRKTPPQRRTVFQEMCAFLREHDIEEILVQDKDRTTRQPGPQVGICHIIEALVGHEVSVYDVNSDRPVSRFESLGDDEEELGRFFAVAAEAASSDIEKAKENKKIQNSLDQKDEQYKPTGKPPRALNSNRVVFGESNSEYYCPLPDGDVDPEEADLRTASYDTFGRAIRALNEWYASDDSAYQVGKEIGYSNPSNTVQSLARNTWKYWQAYQVMQQRDEYPDPPVHARFGDEVPEEAGKID